MQHGRAAARLAGTVSAVFVLGLALAACSGAGAGAQAGNGTTGATGSGGSGASGGSRGSGLSGLGGTGGRQRVVDFGVVGSDGAIVPLEHNRPARVHGIPGRVVQIATSNSDSYALTAAGTVWAWGSGNHGQLGTGSTPDYTARAVEVSFPSGVRIAQLANPMPWDAALAIDTTGRAWGWGADGSRDLCVKGPTVLRPTPLPFSHVTLATGAGGHSVLDTSGTVVACGQNVYGELGDGRMLGRRGPVDVVGLPAHERVTALVSAWQDSGALMADGAYYDWGYNAGGQLGDGSTANGDTAVRVHLPGPVRQVYQGGSMANNGQTLAILRGGEVWEWGNGQWGQLGDGRLGNALVPQRLTMAPGTHWREVVTGGYASYAVSRSGRVWAWGAEHGGEVGNGLTSRLAVRPVRLRLRVTQLSATAYNVTGWLRGAS